MTREQERTFLVILFAIIFLVGFYFPLIWLINIPIIRRIKKIDKENKKDVDKF